VIYLGAPRTMRGPALLLGRIVSGGCWRADPAARSRASPARTRLVASFKTVGDRSASDSQLSSS
jgi:hypothetical protein